MSAGSCLTGLEAMAKIDPERAAAARAMYEERLAEYAASGSREAAEALASRDLLDAMERQLTRKDFLAATAAKVRQRMLEEMGTYRGEGGLGGNRGNGGPGGGLDPRAGRGFFDHDPRAPYSNLEGRRKAVLGDAQRLMDQLMADHHAGFMGKVRNRAQMSDIGRELFGESTGNADAAAMASSWRRAAEYLRQRFNQAGGDIGFRADWGLPQAHDWKAIRAAGFDEWRDFIVPRLDLARMIDTDTGRPMTAAKLNSILPAIFDDIRSQGAASRTPGSKPGGSSAWANRRNDARFFAFRGAAAWEEYGAKFGSGNAYDAMMGHMEGMAREIAALEVLGPNPADSVRWIKAMLDDTARRNRDPGSTGIDEASNAGKQIDDLWNEYSGANLDPRNKRVALVFSSLRNLQVATKLGSAFLSATSDFAFQASRRQFNGLAQKTMLTDWIKLMRPGSIEDQKFAVRRGLIAQEWMSRTAAASRYALEEQGAEWTRRLANGVLQASLLSRHTQAMRWVFGMETLSSFTEAAGKSFAELDPALRGMLHRYGIDAAGWHALRSAPMDTDRGVTWISPHNLQDRALASRFMEMVHEETAIAVPETDLLTRATINSRLERGTLMGEIGRNAFQFKGFGLTVMLRQWREIMAMSGGKAARYTAGLVIGTTLMGGLALQLKAVAAGRDPRPMDDGDFWQAAMLQGGGFGLFGDFLFADQSRYGGFPQSLAGPLVSDAQGIYNVAAAKDPRRQLVREAKGFLPGNNLWYSRLAFDRLMADQMEQAINPAYPAAVRRMERSAREQGTSFFWRPGRDAPARAPDFANAFEEGPAE